MPLLLTLRVPEDCRVMLRIVPAETKEAVHQVSVLFREYAEALGVNLSFQNFERELAELPGEYAPPDGALLLAFAEDLPARPATHSPATVEAVGPSVQEVRRVGGRSFRAFCVPIPSGSSDIKLASPSGVSTPEAQNLTFSAVCGCVALRKIDSDVCEMKRLYVRAGNRGRGVGRALALAVVDSARTIGYRSMRLDTLPQMGEAQSLYTSLGFREIPPYRYNPIPGSRFLEIAIT
jgi:ribosomal protein S18 acetylase RimI-like enzyme